jgi:hypothetical protein
MEGEQGVLGGNQGSFALLCVRSFVLLSYTNQFPSERAFYCKGNLYSAKENTPLRSSQGKSKVNI